jgi:hypothetical protein
MLKTKKQIANILRRYMDKEISKAKAKKELRCNAEVIDYLLTQLAKNLKEPKKYFLKSYTKALDNLLKT